MLLLLLLLLFLLGFFGVVFLAATVVFVAVLVLGLVVNIPSTSHLVFDLSNFIHFLLFFVVFSHDEAILYEGMSVGPSIDMYVTLLLFGLLLLFD